MNPDIEIITKGLITVVFLTTGLEIGFLWLRAVVVGTRGMGGHLDD